MVRFRHGAVAWRRDREIRLDLAGDVHVHRLHRRGTAARLCTACNHRRPEWVAEWLELLDFGADLLRGVWRATSWQSGGDRFRYFHGLRGWHGDVLLAVAYRRLMVRDRQPRVLGLGPDVFVWYAE